MTSQHPTSEAGLYLPGLEPLVHPEEPKWNLERGMAIARMLTPEAMGLAVETYDSVSPEALVEADPARLWSALVGQNVQITRKDSIRPSNGYLFESKPGTWQAVALNFIEAKLIPHYPAAYARGAYETVRKARSSTHTPESQAAALRAAQHTLAPKIDKMQKYHDSTLVSQGTTLDRTGEALKHPGFRRFKDEADMRQRFTEVRGMIDDALQAAAEQRNWTPEQETEVLRAVEKRMVIDRDHNKHIQYTDMLISMLTSYNQQKRALLTTRIAECQAIVTYACDTQ
jgi:hypothetical protein